jgi:hypothetical protein
MTSILPGSLDYTNRDFASIKERLQLDLATVFPTWTDREVRDFGNLLVAMFSHVGDVLGFYQDAQASESRLATAELRQNVVAIAKMLGYAPLARTAATVDVVLEIPAQPASTTIAAGRQVATQGLAPVQYQLLADVVFLPGETAKTVTVENTVTRTDTFVASAAPNQEFILSSVPYVEGSAVVSDATTGPYDAATNPGGWRQVPSFFASSALDAHYVVVVDRDERAHLRFGDGIAGRVPNSVEAQSKEGGGVEGRVELAALTRMIGTVESDAGAVVPVTVSNPSASVGGDAAEGVEQVRINAPENLRVQERAVAREDYEISAIKVPGVVRAFHGTRNQGVAVGENEGILWCVPSSGDEVPQQTLDAVALRFERGGATPKTNTYSLTVASVVWATINVSAVVYLRPGFSAAAARASIEAALTELFRPVLANGALNSNVDFGFYYQDLDGQPTGVLPWDDVRNAIRDASAVRKLDDASVGLLLNGSASDVVIAPFEFPRLGTLTLINGQTGASI